MEMFQVVFDNNNFVPRFALSKNGESFSDNSDVQSSPTHLILIS